jgi:hypothetical protein
LKIELNFIFLPNDSFHAKQLGAVEGKKFNEKSISLEIGGKFLLKTLPDGDGELSRNK